MSDTLFVSFSGGRTSAYMARWIQLNWRDMYRKIYYLFANTGCEHEKTLEFVQRCDDEWGMGIVWIEAVVDRRKGKGIRHKVVSFDTASRHGEPFAAQIQKEGIPNAANPKCSDRLKLRPMNSYRRHLGYGPSDHDTAIGIRVDEVDRMHPRWRELGLVYPLVNYKPMTKEMVYHWWQAQPFDLEIPEHYGNCVWCWKKSLRKLLTIMDEAPEYFYFPETMEKMCGRIKATDQFLSIKEPNKTFFRSGLSTNDLRRMAREPFTRFVDTADGVYTPDMFHDPLDESGGCSESCDIYAEDHEDAA